MKVLYRKTAEIIEDRGVRKIRLTEVDFVKKRVKGRIMPIYADTSKIRWFKS